MVSGNEVGKTLQRENDEMKKNYPRMLEEMEQKKNKIVAFSINTTLQYLKEILEKFEKEDRISAETLQRGLKISRLIVQKAIEEYTACADQKERPLYLMYSKFQI